MIKIPFWIEIHKLLLKYKKIILNLFLLSYIVIAGLIAIGFYSFSSNLSLYFNVSQLASSFGTLSLLLFLITLLPGIFTRFKMLPLLCSSGILFRRQIGILMFATALFHSFYLRTIPAIMTSTLGVGLTSKEVLGTLSLLILLPVWLTSNDISVKKLGKYWKKIQRFTYFALIIIFAHVALNSQKIAIVAFVVFLLEIASWVKVWIKKS